MPTMSLGDFFRLHFGGVQTRSLYLTIPGSHLGSILAAREEETGTLFAQARVASGMPGKGDAESLQAIEDTLRRAFGTLYKNILVSLPGVRTTQIDPVAFVHEFHAGFRGFSHVNSPDMDIAWTRSTPYRHIQNLLRTIGRDIQDIYGAPNPERVEISPTDPEHGLVLAPPKVLAPRAGEIPALLIYSLAPM